MLSNVIGDKDRYSLTKNTEAKDICNQYLYACMFSALRPILWKRKKTYKNVMLLQANNFTSSLKFNLLDNYGSV